jgi:hypothetical protein
MIDRLDHLVLTTAREADCVHFYCTVLGMTLQTFGEGRKAFVFNGQKINLHIQGHEFEPKALHPMPGRWICVSSPPCRWRRCSSTWQSMALPSNAARCNAPARADPSSRSTCATRTIT